MITEQLSSIESQTIKFASYNFMTNRLKLIFNSGDAYEYLDVPHEVYDEFCKAESHGKFLAQKIKRNYEFIKNEQHDQ